VDHWIVFFPGEAAVRGGVFPYFGRHGSGRCVR
jgi:D-hexose-6-phosphate mutarotase